VPPPAFAFDAASLAKVPVLGYDIADFPPADVPASAERVLQPWIRAEADVVTIDVGEFAVHALFDALLVSGSTTSRPVSSLGAASSEFARRWKLPDQLAEGVGGLR
jgi:hypothetical protein